MRRQHFVLIVASAFFTFFLTACGGGSSSSTPSTTASNSAPAASSAQPGTGSGSSSSGSSGSGTGSSSGSSGSGSAGSGSGSGSTPSPGSGSGSTGLGSGGSGTPGTTQGGFTETKYSIPATGSVLAADFNHDGRPDLLIFGSTLQVLINNGSGGFSAPITIALPAGINRALQVALADFNGDGYLDVAVCSGGSGANSAVVYLNDHSGNLIAGQTLTTPNGCNGISAGDANRDGKIDLAVTSVSGPATSPVNSISTYFGDGTGHFGSPVTQSNLALTFNQDPSQNPCQSQTSTGADFNGDGVLDVLIFSSCNLNPVTTGDVYLATGDGTGHYALKEVDEGNYSVDLRSAPFIKDINGDGKPDVIYDNSQAGPHGSSNSKLEFAINNGTGFTISTAASESAYAASGAYVETGSSLGNATQAVEGFLDATCCNPSSYGVKLVSNGTVAQKWTFGTAPNTADTPGSVQGIDSADFDGNGTQDFAVAEADSNAKATLHVFLNSNK